jgi:hypothetical protein
MSATLVETSLGLPAQHFIQERLADGNTFAQEIAKRIQLVQGRITTLLPSGVVPRSIEDFRTGGKLPIPSTREWKGTQPRDETLLMIPVPNTNSWLANKVRIYLSHAKDRACIIEDALKHPTDAVLHSLSTRYAIYKNEVYHVLLHDDARDERIMETLRAAQSIPTFIGSLSIWQDGSKQLKGRALSLEQLQLLAANTEELFVGAYDGEGYLYWRRDPRF